MIQNKSDQKVNILAIVIFASIPFIQLGFSYYISVSFFVFLIAFYYSASSTTFLNKDSLVLQIGVAAFIIKTIMLTLTSNDTRSILIPVREMTCFIGMFIISSKLSKTTIRINILNKLLVGLLLLILGLVIFQLYQLSSGRYFGFPIETFIMNKAALDGVHLALEHKTRFRPTSFYGEPSYTSWVALSIFTVALLNPDLKLKKALYLLLLSFCIVAISQSVSGVLAIVIVFTYWFLDKKKSQSSKGWRIILGLGAAIVLLSIASLFSDDLNSRFKGIIESTDASSNGRFQNPFIYISKSLSEGQFFGVSNYAELDIDNAALGLFIQYGIFSLLILTCVLKKAKNNLLILFLILSLNFNGTFFRYDKVLIISFVIGIGQGFISISENNRLNVSRKRFYKAQIDI